MPFSELPFAEGSEIFRWGPIPGTVLYPSAFLPPVFWGVPKVYPHARWPKTLQLHHGGRMVWLNDVAELREAGRAAFTTYILPDDSRSAMWQAYVSSRAGLCAAYERVRSAAFESLAPDELLALWSSFHKTYDAFWVPTIPAELGNYGSIEYFEEHLSRVVGDASARTSITEVLTAPEAMSFYQEEEVALAETETLAAHAERFSWIQNSYAGAAPAPRSYFEERKRTLSPTIRQEIEQKREEVIRAKLHITSEYHLSPELVHIADTIVRAIEWQDNRKKHIFMAIEAEFRMVQEITRRLSLPAGDLLLLTWWEIEGLLGGDETIQGEITKRREWGGFFYALGQEEVLSPDAARSYWERYAEEHVDPVGASEVQGVVVSKGKGNIRARVRIVLDPSRAHEFQAGEILLAPMTSPEYVFAMRKAAAVITDAGGLTSHAAIVSRELGIPCIVGTKVATKVFHNGDCIEVDITSGVARKV